MPVLGNPKHEKFCQAYAATGNAAESYASAGYEPKGAAQAASRLLRDVKVTARVTELRERIVERVVKLEIGVRSARIAAQQARWDKLQEVIAARAVDPAMQAAAGGNTGLLVRTLKAVGQMPVEEFAVDTGTLREIRELEKQAAVEVGQWTEKSELTGADGGPIDNNVNVRFVE